MIINEFALPSGSSLHNRPIESLKSFDSISVPIVTVVYGKDLDTMKLLEVSLNINGNQVYYNS